MTYGDPDLIARIKAMNAEYVAANPPPPRPEPEPPAMCSECGIEAASRDYYFAGWCKPCLTEHRKAKKQESARRSREKRAGASKVSALDRRIAVDYVRHVLRHRTCEYCGAAPFKHVEHRVPLARGGSGFWFNLASSCAACNLCKGTKTEDEFKAILRRERNWAI